MSTYTKEGKLDEKNNIDFSALKNLGFTSFNATKNIIDIFLQVTKDDKKKDFKKVDSINGDLNYYRIESKDIEIKDEFKELTFDIVNHISLTIDIKFKNKSSKTHAKRFSVSDRASMFNQKKETTQDTKNKYIPKKFASNVFFPNQSKLEKKEETKNLKYNQNKNKTGENNKVMNIIKAIDKRQDIKNEKENKGEKSIKNAQEINKKEGTIKNEEEPKNNEKEIKDEKNKKNNIEVNKLENKENKEKGIKSEKNKNSKNK